MKNKIKKKLGLILSILLTATMIPLLPVAAETETSPLTNESKLEEAIPFKDVTGSLIDEVYASVSYVFRNDLMDGVSDREFKPDDNLTRAMYITVLGRTAEIDTSQYNTETTFTDEKTGQWYTPYVEWAYQNKITYGMGDQKFGIDLEVTREQIATFIARYLKAQSISLQNVDNRPASFSDANNIHDWASEGVELMRKTGILQGDPDGKFRPQDGTTRAEAAIIFMRLDKAIKSSDQASVEYTEEFQRMIDINDGELPKIYLEDDDDIPEGIIGKYSEKKVTDGESAIESLKDIKKLMRINDAEKEFIVIDSSEKDGINYFRLQQMYNNVKVYGKQLIITSDINGTILSLTGDYDPIEGEVNETDTVSMEQAYKIAKTVCDDVDTEGHKIVYTLDVGVNEYAWIFTGNMNIVISAADGDTLDSWDTINFEYTSSKGNGHPGNDTENANRNYEFSTVKDDKGNVASSDDEYVFYDSERNIAYFDLGGQDATLEYVYLEIPGNNKAYNVPILKNHSTIWAGETNEKAITLCENLNRVYDYYRDVLQIKSYDNKGGRIFAGINEGWDGGNNAYNAGPGLDDEGNNYTYMMFGSNSNFQNNLDVVGHEFTHAIQHSRVSDLVYKKETGSLMEAYSDVGGELVELYTLGWTDWINERDRNLRNPIESKNPSSYRGMFWEPSPRNDGGGRHQNSTVISHTIYEIYNRGIDDVLKLTNLLYNTWGYLSSNAGFSEYAVSMMAAANTMNFTQEELNIIKSAFEDAEIPLKEIDYSMLSIEQTFHITDKSGKSIPNAYVSIYNVSNPDEEIGEVVTDNNGIAKISIPYSQRKNYMVKVFASEYEEYQENHSSSVFSGGDIEIQLKGINDSVTYSTKRDDRSIYSGNEELVTNYFDQIVVDGNDSSISKMNLALQQEHDNFFDRVKDNEDTYGPIKEWGNDNGASFYIVDSSVVNNSDSIFSVRYHEQFENNGGIINECYYGQTFDIKTGEILSISKLFDMSDDAALAYIKQQTRKYIDEHPDYSWWNDDLLPELNLNKIVDELDLDSFAGYYCQNNSVFICFDPYTLGPGALGSIIVECPIKDK